MPQATYIQANAVGAAYLTALNEHLAAGVTNNSGASEPGTTYASMFWADSSTGPPWEIKVRSHDDASWATFMNTDGGIIAGAASTFAGDVDITGDVKISDATNVILELHETSATADEGRWQFVAGADAFSLVLPNDAGSASSTAFIISRTAENVQEFRVIPDAKILGVITAGSSPIQITTTAGLLRHQAINPAIAGTGLGVATGVLSVDWANPGTIGSGTPNTGNFTTLDTTGLLTVNSDADGVTILGRAKIGTTAGHLDNAIFGHFDRFGDLTHGMRITPAGQTNINTRLNQILGFRQNDVLVGQIDATTGNWDFKTDVVMEGDLQVAGDLLFTGAAGEGLPYGAMGQENIPTTVTIITIGVPVSIIGMTGGETNLVTFQAGRELKALEEGRYAINWSVSFNMASGSGQEIEGRIGVGGVPQAEGSAHRSIGTGNDTGSMSGSTVLDLITNAVVTVMVENETNTTNIVVQHASLTMIGVGGS